MFKILILSLLLHETTCYWDIATTTVRDPRTDTTPRQSFFRWQWISFPQWWFWNYDWTEIHRRRRLNAIAGISIDFLCLSTAVIMNRRVLITSYNYMHPYMPRMQDLRIWALGRTGEHYTPYRYRVYRVTRPVPLSLNPEHCHGPRCTHQPRHDVVVMISQDQMYLYNYYPTRYHYAFRAYLTEKYTQLWGEVWFAGSGFEYMEHIVQNYKIFFAITHRSSVVDCSKYIPKWWGKFICIRNWHVFPGVQNGGGLFTDHTLIGLGCFEIRVNDDRIYVFTDLRYYYNLIHHYAYIWPGAYYEYAYPQWGIALYWIHDGSSNNPYVPGWQIMDDLYPLGKK